MVEPESPSPSPGLSKSLEALTRFFGSKRKSDSHGTPVQPPTAATSQPELNVNEQTPVDLPAKLVEESSDPAADRVKEPWTQEEIVELAEVNTQPVETRSPLPQAEIDSITAEDELPLGVDAAVADEYAQPQIRNDFNVSEMELNASIAGHNLMLSSLLMRAKRTLASNGQDLPATMDRLDSLWQSHQKIRVQMDMVEDSKKLIELDNMHHVIIELTGLVNDFEPVDEVLEEGSDGSIEIAGISQMQLEDVKQRLQSIFDASHGQ